MKKCPRCNGRGTFFGRTDSMCKGSGYVPCCKSCHGAGLIPNPFTPLSVSECVECLGTGYGRGALIRARQLARVLASSPAKE